MLDRRPWTDCHFLKSDCPGAERVSVEKVMKDRNVAEASFQCVEAGLQSMYAYIQYTQACVYIYIYT